jgi:hypothetical protein
MAVTAVAMMPAVVMTAMMPAVVTSVVAAMPMTR